MRTELAAIAHLRDQAFRHASGTMTHPSQSS